MNSRILGLRIAGALFALICLGHLLRLVGRVEVTIAGYTVPMWLSLVAAVFSAGLAAWMWILSRRPKDTTTT